MEWCSLPPLSWPLWGEFQLPFPLILGSLGLKVLDARRRIIFIRRHNKNPGFPGGSEGKVSACNVEDLGLIPGLGRSPGEGNGNPLQYSCLENYMDCILHRATKSQTWLSNFRISKDLEPCLVKELPRFPSVFHKTNFFLHFKLKKIKP